MIASEKNMVYKGPFFDGDVHVFSEIRVDNDGNWIIHLFHLADSPQKWLEKERLFSPPGL
jgi:hypothetical protein